MPHNNKYRLLYHAMAIKLGDTYKGRDRAEWWRLIQEDEHLNNVPLREWQSHFEGMRNPLWKGWTLSASDCVCMLKRCVIDTYSLDTYKDSLVNTQYMAIIRKDGELKAIVEGKNGVYEWFAKHCLAYSMEHALAHEGYTVEAYEFVPDNS